MAGFKGFILVLHVAAGLLAAALAVPLIRRKVRPNALYGFRVRRTLGDPAAWYAANAFAGRCLFASGLAIALASLALSLIPGLDPVSYAWACLAITLVVLAASVFLSFRFLDRLPRA